MRSGERRSDFLRRGAPPCVACGPRRRGHTASAGQLREREVPGLYRVGMRTGYCTYKLSSNKSNR